MIFNVYLGFHCIGKPIYLIFSHFYIFFALINNPCDEDPEPKQLFTLLIISLSQINRISKSKIMNSLFFLFLAASGLSCGAPALPCGAWASLLLWCAGFSLVVACRFFLSLAVVRGLQSTWALQFAACGLQLRHASSVVVVRVPSCPTACGILVP